MGDSSGGNLAAALCLLARDCGEFSIYKQILVYPAVNNCYTLDSVYDSIRENGEGYLLTRGKMHDYLQLYIGKQEDLKSPYVAPVLAEDLTNMPETLVLSAEFDPLRDEGEDYAKRLKEAGNKATCYRIAGAFHGYFALGVSRLHVEESFAYIDHFYGRGNDAEKKRSQWRKLDNAAQAFPAATGKKDTRVFRLYCELKEDVIEEVLQKQWNVRWKSIRCIVRFSGKGCSGSIWSSGI